MAKKKRSGTAMKLNVWSWARSCIGQTYTLSAETVTKSGAGLTGLLARQDQKFSKE
jgi:hypothetical protein